MKSLLISGAYFPPQVGGISHYMASIASALGPEQVCCLTGVRAGAGFSGNLEPRVYRRPAAFAKNTYVQLAGLGAVVAEIVVREQPRVIQVATAAEGYLGLWLNRVLRLPYVVYAHGNEVLDAIRSSWDKPRLALRRATCVLANSRFTAGLVEEAGVDRTRIRVVHPGCDIDLFKPLPADMELKRRLLGDRAGGRVVLSVGGLVARKGYDTVIRSLPQVIRRCPDLTYLIVTSNARNYDRELKALAHSIGVGEHVVFAYDVVDADLPRVYGLSDAFVMPSREHREMCDVEGFGMVFLEASACGKACVGGRSGGIADAIVDGVTGILVDPHDASDVAAGLTRVLEDRSLAGEMGRQGRLRAVREFSWARVAGQIREIVNSAAAVERSPVVPIGSKSAR